MWHSCMVFKKLYNEEPKKSSVSHLLWVIQDTDPSGCVFCLNLALEGKRWLQKFIFSQVAMACMSSSMSSQMVNSLNHQAI